MRTSYALTTYLDTYDSPFGGFVRGRAMCSDGRVRNLKRISVTADTFFSVPASVTVKGRTIAGYVGVETCQGWTTHTDEGWTTHGTGDDPALVKFHAYTYRKNHELLPAGSWKGSYLDTEEGVLKYLLTDTGRVPCSRYGYDSASCAPVAWALSVILRGETSEPTTKEGLDHLMGLVVNDYDDPEDLIREYGRQYGFNPRDYLD